MGFDSCEIALKAQAFSEERDWEMFYSLKNLAMAFTGEVDEFVEIPECKSDRKASELLTTDSRRAPFPL